MDWSTVGFAFGLTLFAGLPPELEVQLHFLPKRTNTGFFRSHLVFQQV